MYTDGSGTGVANGRQIQGKELSYNNIVDLQAAWDLAQEFDETVCAIIKHTNPAAPQPARTLAEAYKKALECDPVSAFGGVIGVNRTVDADAAEEMAKLFLEVIAAPGLRRSARAKFAVKEKSASGRDQPCAAKVGAEKCFRRNARCRTLMPATLERSRFEGRNQAPTHARRKARAALRLEGLQAREVECDSLCA